ncbi:hypothetical protein [Achromobacter pestifer]
MESVAAWLLSSTPAAWLQALGTPIIGIGAAYIAYQSARTARNKLKFDMFEKRLQTYRDLSTLISDAAQAGWFSFPLMKNYRQLQAQARFLFSDKAIDAFLNKAVSHLFALIPVEGVFDPESEEFEELKFKHRKAVMWWQHGKLMAPHNREQLIHDHPWLSSATWLDANGATLDSLTLPYLRLSH